MTIGLHEVFNRWRTCSHHIVLNIEKYNNGNEDGAIYFVNFCSFLYRTMATALPIFPEFNLRDQNNLGAQWENI